MKILYYAGWVVCLTGAALAGDSPAGGAASAEDYLRAIRANDLGYLQKMSQRHMADVRDGLGWTPLHYAALYGSPEAVRVLLEAGADPNGRNQAQVTPLMFGAYSLEKTRLLVEKGADVNAKAKDGTTPLWVAAGAQGNERTVRYLLEKGANVKEIRPGGADYLIRAAAHQDAGTIRLLLEKGLEPRRATEDGDTSLTAAFSIGEHQKAGILLAAGADANAANTNAGTVKNGPVDSFGVTADAGGDHGRSGGDFGADQGGGEVGHDRSSAHDCPDDGGGHRPGECGDRTAADRRRSGPERGGPLRRDGTRLGAEVSQSGSIGGARKSRGDG
jgi:hypothetical protein